jgi:hypothetical protein
MFNEDGQWIDPTTPEDGNPTGNVDTSSDGESSNAFADLMKQFGGNADDEKSEAEKETAELLKALGSDTNEAEDEEEQSKTSIVLEKLINRLDQAEEETSELDKHFNNVFGDPIDFSRMMQEEGDPEEINKLMQQEVQEKMKLVYQDALQQSVALAKQMVDKELQSFRNEFKSESAMDKLNGMIATHMPKAATPENEVVMKALLPPLMKHAKNDPAKAFKLLTTFFNKTNKSMLSNNKKSGRFGTSETTSKSSGELTLESVVGFLG